MRLLDAAGIPYTVLSYHADGPDLSAVHAAERTGFPVERIFKTLVLQGSSGVRLVCCIPAAEELDLKKAARLAGEKKADLVPVKHLLPLTGYVRGGCSPVGMKKSFPTFIDETAVLFSAVSVSAGERGLLMVLHPADLLRCTRGVTADLTLVP
ncbi:MAG: Cys-tRNA(Pro) deacylase [Treponema sp.]|nr:Cys-tRNA(Pro) deacylase [Treponema sp.]